MKADPATQADPKPSDIWLMWIWIYVIVPIFPLGILGFSFFGENSRQSVNGEQLIFVAICSALIYGLHKKKKWAWYLNWVGILAIASVPLKFGAVGGVLSGLWLWWNYLVWNRLKIRVFGSSKSPVSWRDLESVCFFNASSMLVKDENIEEKELDKIIFDEIRNKGWHLNQGQLNVVKLFIGGCYLLPTLRQHLIELGSIKSSSTQKKFNEINEVLSRHGMQFEDTPSIEDIKTWLNSDTTLKDSTENNHESNSSQDWGRKIDKISKDVDSKGTIDPNWKLAISEFDENRHAKTWKESLNAANGDQAVAKQNYLRVRALHFSELNGEALGLSRRAERPSSRPVVSEPTASKVKVGDGSSQSLLSRMSGEFVVVILVVALVIGIIYQEATKTNLPSTTATQASARPEALAFTDVGTAKNGARMSVSSRIRNAAGTGVTFELKRELQKSEIDQPSGRHYSRTVGNVELDCIDAEYYYSQERRLSERDEVVAHLDKVQEPAPFSNFISLEGFFHDWCEDANIQPKVYPVSGSVRVISENANIRDKPRVTGSQILRSVPKHSTFEPIGLVGEFYFVVDENGVGYISRRTVIHEQ